MGNSAGKVTRSCTRDTLPPYEPRVELTDRDIAVTGAEETLRARRHCGLRAGKEMYEVAWAAVRSAGVLVYVGPKHLSTTRAYAILVGVVQGYNPALGQSTAVFDPVAQRLTWHDGTPIHTPTWSVTTRWWRSKFAEESDPFLAELVAKQSETPVDGLSPEWADELCRAISQNWHLHARYSVLGSAAEGFWVEFD